MQFIGATLAIAASVAAATTTTDFPTTNPTEAPSAEAAKALVPLAEIPDMEISPKNIRNFFAELNDIMAKLEDEAVKAAESGELDAILQEFPRFETFPGVIGF